MLRRTICIAVLACCILWAGIADFKVKRKWEIRFGKRADNIQLIDALVLYDFEVYAGKLYLCDIARSQIKNFDPAGHLVRSLQLPATPEIIKIWHGVLVVLMQNGEVGVYSIKENTFTSIKLGLAIASYNYSHAFFSDSLLYIPTTSGFIWEKSDAYVIDIARLPKLEIVIEMGFYDSEKRWGIPADSGSIEKHEYLIRQGDFRYCSRNLSVVRRSEEHRHGERTQEYLLINRETRRAQTILRVTPVDTLSLMLGGVCRGFRVYDDGIYFIRSRFENHKEKSLIISKIPLLP